MKNKLATEVKGDDRLWLALRDQSVRWNGDPFAPAVDDGRTASGGGASNSRDTRQEVKRVRRLATRVDSD